MNLLIDTQPIGLGQLREVWQKHCDVSLGPAARQLVERSQQQIDQVLQSGETVYGVNTGFGQLAQVRISEDELVHLQENLVRSHAVGVGEALAESTVRLTMVMKVIGLARGCSGVRPQLVDALCALIRHRVIPVIPSRGSVGASGDLAPLAHMAGVLLGLGEACIDGDRMPAGEALRRAGIEPLVLAPKEGLALLNGTQVSTAISLAALFRAEHMLAASLVTGALTADAIKGSDTPFDERIQLARGHAGQIDVAELLRNLMHGSEIRASHLDCDRVQDPYSIRCQPQVAGACLDVLRHVGSVLAVEANAVTDNPLAFAESAAVLSGGNFHAEPIALAADYLALAIAEAGSLAERRVALLIDSHLSGLPAFLVEHSGLNSGFMMAQVTAAALASDNKSLAHPASVDSIPTSANQEDHVSMATGAALRLHKMLDNSACIVAIEMLAACQGIEFHRPKKTSKTLETVLSKVRKLSPRYAEDRSLSPDIQAVAELIENGAFFDMARRILPSGST
ncbi:MAG: histidine ammonia-lyase [Gammaproteobacteria bacterium]|nr:histidine ammonia-lyase [Gammaproteobacteria bacterium]